jgi:hypothetical protein
MTTTNEPTRTGRPSPSPASSSTVAIILAVIAAVVGFFIIKQVRDDGNGGGGSPSASSTQGTGSTIDTGSLPTVTGGVPTTTGFTTTGSTVQVVNASAQNGVAGQLTTALAAQKFTMAAAGNGASKSDTTHVYYDPAKPAAKPVADSVASLMGIAASEPMPTPIPTKDGTLPEGCGVLVVLGADKAGKPLTEMGGTATTLAPTSGATSTSAG